MSITTIQLCAIGVAMLVVYFGGHALAYRVAAGTLPTGIDRAEDGYWVGFAGPFQTLEEAVRFRNLSHPF